MKKLLLTLVFVFLSVNAFSQKTQDEIQSNEILMTNILEKEERILNLVQSHKDLSTDQFQLIKSLLSNVENEVTSASNLYSTRNKETYFLLKKINNNLIKLEIDLQNDILNFYKPLNK